MGLPENLLMVRHGQSQGNVASSASKRGDYSLFTEDYVNTPGRKWHLTERGVQQAQVIGGWLRDEFQNGFLAKPHYGKRFYVSPFTRTRETAGHLNLRDFERVDQPSVEWYLNRSIRERDWGDIETIPRNLIEKDPFYANSMRKKRMDPLYWKAPGGESLADVADNRVRNFLDTLHRECDGWTVLGVSHGEFMRATHLVLTRADDEQYMEWEQDPAMLIRNCEVFQYTRRVPEERFLGRWEKPGDPAEQRAWPTRNRLQYFRRVFPTDIHGDWQVVVGDWEEIQYEHPTNGELLLP